MYQNPLLGSDQWKYNEGLATSPRSNATGYSNVAEGGYDWDRFVSSLTKNQPRSQAVPSPSYGQQNYMTYPSSTENIDGLAGTARPNVTSRDYSFSGLNSNRDALFESGRQPGTYSDLSKAVPPPADTTMWQKFKSGVSNYGKDADGKYSGGGNPLVRDLTAVGGLGLGIASFLEQRKTAGLQRDALRHDIATAKEHRANRQALGDSWNRAWSK